MRKLKIGVSACLIGLKYRYDGTSKMDSRLIEGLGGKVDFIPVCPEVECGLAIPRKVMRLEASPRGTRLKVTETGEDLTSQMEEWSRIKIEKLAALDIAAFIFKARSPSCGFGSTSVFDSKGRVITLDGTGIFAKILTGAFPNMIVGEEVDIEKFIKILGV